MWVFFSFFVCSQKQKAPVHSGAYDCDVVFIQEQ